MIYDCFGVVKAEKLNQTDLILISLLQSGSYAKVREGVDVETFERVAIKIFQRKKLVKMTGGDLNVQREINIIQCMKHKNVVEFMDSFNMDMKDKL